MTTVRTDSLTLRLNEDTTHTAESIAKAARDRGLDAKVNASLQRQQVRVSGQHLGWLDELVERFGGEVSR